ncbi:MAG: DUF742 domain-containing protein [Acidimicrobiales bacterium]
MTEPNASPRNLLVRPYAVTGGRTRSRPVDLPLETLVTTTDEGHRSLTSLKFECRSIATLCREPVSVAEVAARVGVPLGVARVLVGDMTDDGHLEVHLPGGSERPDVVLLERVLDGLRGI